MLVYNYNRVQGDNFQVYYLQQDPDYVVSQSVYDDDGNVILNGSPQEGLTNQQIWDQYGIALAGAVAPSNQTRDGVLGFIQPF